MNIHITRHLTAEEGLRLEPYKDSEGYWTIGIGHLIDARKGGTLPEWVRSFPIRVQDAEDMLKDDVEDVEWLVSEAIPEYDHMTKVRQAVLLSMAFQMGIWGLLGFKRMLRALRREEFQVAAAEMLDSKWARQTRGRAGRLANAMRSNNAAFLEGSDHD